MRVLTLTSWFPPHHHGGYETACEDVSRRLVERGHEVHVLCSDQVLDPGATPGPLEPHVRRRLRVGLRDGALVTPGLRERLRDERHNHAALAAALDAVRPDAVAVWHVGALSVGLLTALDERRLPTVFVVCDDWPTYAHRLDPWAKPFLARRGGRRLATLLRPLTKVPPPPTALGDPARSATLMISERTRDRCVAATAFALPRVVVARQGLDGRRFADAPSRDPHRPFGWDLLFVGRFDPRKGCDTLVRALPLLPRARCHLDGRGTDADRERLRALAAELGVADRVTVATSPRQELPARYAEADAFVFPSEWEEPFGLTPLEAMACGTPVVATSVGGSGEFLVDGVNVVGARPGDPADLAAAIDHLAGLDGATRAALVDAGRRTAAELDAERTTDDVEAWLLAAVGGFAGGEPPVRPRPLDGATPVAPARRPTLGHPMAADADPQPLAAHQRSAEEVLASGDPDAIKGLYVELGEGWWATHANSLDDIPVLSLPETHPVVTGLLAASRGLVLDAGCGPNPAVSCTLAEDGRRTVVSMDIGLGTVRVARRFAAAKGLTLLGVVGDLERLPFRDGAFDAVVSDDTIEHLPDDAAGVAGLVRVAKAGADVVLATPNRLNAFILKRRVVDSLRRRRWQPAAPYFLSNSHLREYTWTEFERLVGAAAPVVERAGVGWHAGAPTWKQRLASRLVALGPGRRFGQMIVLRAAGRGR